MQQGQRGVTMKKKQLGDMEITRLGLGTWAIGGNNGEWGWGDQDDRDSVKTIHKALDYGINWIDTAPCYGLGHSEKVIARALEQTDKKPCIFTKAGLCWEKGKTTLFNRLTKESVFKEVEESLRRLKRETIDLYQIHWPLPSEDIEEAWSAFVQLKEQGKIRHIGVSNFSKEQLERVADIAPVVSSQPPYSLIDRDAEKEVFPYCEEKGIGILNYSPMASGMLTGRMTRKRRDLLPKEDWRWKNHHFREPFFSRNLKLVEILKIIAEEHEATVAETAIAFSLEHSAVTASIVGLRTPAQVDGVIRGGDLILSEEQKKRVYDFLRDNPC